jgi:hypothetical protein
MRCKKGDLAIVVSANYEENIGCIVTIISMVSTNGFLNMQNQGPLWLVSCQHNMKWTFNTKVFRKKCGPVPDCFLQPIRGIELSSVVTKKCHLRNQRTKSATSHSGLRRLLTSQIQLEIAASPNIKWIERTLHKSNKKNGNATVLV